jgi:hypothetical protein
MIEAVFESATGSRRVSYRQRTLPKDEGLTVPAGGDFFRILHDFELSEYNQKPRQLDDGWEQDVPTAMPSTRMLWGCRPSDFLPMSREWQIWLYELLKWAVDDRIPAGNMTQIGSLQWAYADLIANHRAFTDQHAPENGYADYVTGRNITAKPYEWKCLQTSGNLVKKVSYPASATAWFKTHCIAIEALDPSQPPPKLEWVLKEKPHLIGWATEQSVTKLSNGRWVVSRFPQLKVATRAYGIPEVGTPFPVIGTGGVNFIKKIHVKAIASGAGYSPYVPEK